MPRKQLRDQNYQRPTSHNLTQRPAMNPVLREQQLVNLAVKLAEKQLMDGTAPPSVVNHYLKLATQEDFLKRAKLERELELITAKTEALQSNKRIEELYKEASDAMSKYAPSQD